MRTNNRTERRNINATVKKISETFRILVQKTKSSTRSTKRTSSAEVAETNECLEIGGRSAAASPARCLQ